MDCKGDSSNEKNSAKNHQQMYSYSICVAGKSFSIQSANPHIMSEYQSYITVSNHPDLTIDLSNKSIISGIQNLYNDNLPSINAFGDKVAVMYNYLGFESLYVLHRIADHLLKSGIILLHSAALAVDNKCFLFVAPSGTGKTTHVLNWVKTIPYSFIVNGDKPFIDVAKKIVYGSPWSGKEKLNRNTSVPLSAIVILNRGETNTIESVRFHEILPSLLSQMYIPADSSLRIHAYSLIGSLFTIPCYKLTCNMEQESAIVAYNGLMGKRNA